MIKLSGMSLVSALHEISLVPLYIVTKLHLQISHVYDCQPPYCETGNPALYLILCISVRLIHRMISFWMWWCTESTARACGCTVVVVVVSIYRSLRTMSIWVCMYENAGWITITSPRMKVTLHKGDPGPTCFPVSVCSYNNILAIIIMSCSLLNVYISILG